MSIKPSSLKCNTCNEQTLETITTALGNLERCPTCQSFWVEQKTLAAYSDDKTTCRAALDETKTLLLPTERWCPKCFQKMVDGRVRSRSVILHLCQTCTAIWTDWETLKKFDEAIERTLHAQVDAARTAPTLFKDIPPATDAPTRPLMDDKGVAKILRGIARTFDNMADGAGGTTVPRPPVKPPKPAESKPKAEPAKPKAEPVKPKAEPVKPTVEPKPEPKAEPAVERVIPEPVVEKRPEPIIEPPKPAPVVEKKPEPVVVPVKVDPVPEPLPEPKPEPKVEPRPEIKSELDDFRNLLGGIRIPDKPKLEPKPKAEPKPGPAPVAKPDPKPEPVVEPKPISKPAPVVPVPKPVIPKPTPLPKPVQPQGPGFLSRLSAFLNPKPPVSKPKPAPVPTPVVAPPPAVTPASVESKPAPVVVVPKPSPRPSVPRKPGTPTGIWMRVMPLGLALMAFLVNVARGYDFEWSFGILWAVFFWSIGSMIRWWRYYSSAPLAVTSLKDILATTGLSPSKGYFVELSGVIEPADPANPKGPVVFVQNGERVQLNRLSITDVMPRLFGIANPAQMILGEVLLRGWYRRLPVPFIDVSEVKAGKKFRKASSKGLRWGCAILVAALTALILLTAE